MEHRERELQQVQTMAQIVLEAKEKVLESQNEVRAQGITIDNTEQFYPKGYVVAETKEGMGFGKVGKYSYNPNSEMISGTHYDKPNHDREGYGIVFNGVTVTKESLDDELANHTSTNEFNSWIENNEVVEEKDLEALKATIAAKQNELNNKMFGKQGLVEELQVLNTTLEKKQQAYTEYQEKKQKKEFFENLTEEQIQGMQKYFARLDIYSDLCEVYSKLINYNIRATYNDRDASILQNIVASLDEIYQRKAELEAKEKAKTEVKKDPTDSIFDKLDHHMEVFPIEEEKTLSEPTGKTK